MNYESESKNMFGMFLIVCANVEQYVIQQFFYPSGRLEYTLNCILSYQKGVVSDIVIFVAARWNNTNTAASKYAIETVCQTHCHLAAQA